uniref:MICAL-like protein 1 n=1 Tax=Dermatophagoides pteronyssinus TaxID=6956 RepID=A0A6P6YEK9_DERPT|nr:MICAL-like protein 1 [Dermatophagoides pteronyssinus]
METTIISDKNDDEKLTNDIDIDDSNEPKIMMVVKDSSSPKPPSEPQSQTDFENMDDEKLTNDLDLECKKIETLIQTLDQIELESLPSSDVDVDDDRNDAADDIRSEHCQPVDDDDDNDEKSTIKLDENKEVEEKIEIKQTKQIPIPKERKSKCFIVKNVDDNNNDDEQQQQQKQLEISKEKMPTATTSKEKPKIYPDDLNPFGDDDDDEIQDEKSSPKSKTVIKIEHYPGDLNPFGDDDDGDQNNSSLNPFGSDDDDDDDKQIKLTKTPDQQQRSSMKSSPTPTSKRKKRPAPPPPPPQTLSSSSLSNKSNQSLDQIVDKSMVIAKESDSQMFDSFISNASSSNFDTESFDDDNGGDGGNNSRNSIHHQLDVPRTPTPLPRRRKNNQNDVSSDGRKSSSSLIVSSITGSNNNDIDGNDSVQAQLKAIKNKKRPAPPRPAYKRELKQSTIEDMDKELNDIGDQLPIVEKERFELEKWLLLLNEEKESEPQQQPEEREQKLERFLELAREKCKLCRKQKELMYMKREHKLEEIQLELEYQLRIIMSKQDAQKTADDRDEEQRLLKKMMEIIDERNDIIENMIQDENKEIEEYQKIIGKVIDIRTKSEEREIGGGGGSGSGSKHHHHHLKPFHKLKKLNKKIKTKLKSNNKKQHQQQNGDDHSQDGKSIDESSESINSGGSTSINDLSIGQDCQSIGNTSVVDDGGDGDKKSEKSLTKKSSTFGRTTLKKLSNPSKTILNVSNELKSKFHHKSHSNITNQ